MEVFRIRSIEVTERTLQKGSRGFGWTINWSSNGIRPNKQQTGPETPRTFTIEIRNIQYDCTPTIRSDGFCEPVWLWPHLRTTYTIGQSPPSWVAGCSSAGRPAQGTSGRHIQNQKIFALNGHASLQEGHWGHSENGDPGSSTKNCMMFGDQITP